MDLLRLDGWPMSDAISGGTHNVVGKSESVKMGGRLLKHLSVTFTT